MIERGRTNTIALRTHCGTEVFGANGIYQRMFFYTPKSENVPQE